VYTSGPDPQTAGGIVLAIMKKLVSKINDPNDNSFDLQSVLIPSVMAKRRNKY